MTDNQTMTAPPSDTDSTATAEDTSSAKDSATGTSAEAATANAKETAKTDLASTETAASPTEAKPEGEAKPVAEPQPEAAAPTAAAEPVAQDAAKAADSAKTDGDAASDTGDKDKGDKKGKSAVIKAAAKKIAGKSKKKQAPEAPHVQRFRDAKESNELLNGKVIGWNNGGFHVVIDKVTAFCPHSEMDTQRIDDPKEYLDKEFEFAVLRIQDRGRRIVVSRSKLMRKEAQKQARVLRDTLSVGAVVTGRVDSIADFGAFVDLGGLRGLVHISEISRQRVGHPSDELTVGQEVEVKIIRLEEKGKRISLSIKELLPDPWRDIREKYPEGELFVAKVESATTVGAVIELEPGLTGWLPRSAMSLPQNASVPRAYPVGKEVKVQIGGIDPRRQRLTLGLEGKAVEGSKSDLRDFQKQQQQGNDSFGSMAAAFASLRKG